MSFILPAIACYRLPFFDRVGAALDVAVWSAGGESPATMAGCSFAYHRLGRRRLLGSTLHAFTGLTRASLDADVLVGELNPRNLTLWNLLRRSRLSGGRPVMLWGHAWPRGGEAARTVLLRKAMMRRAAGLVAYTEPDAEVMRALAPGRPVGVATNSLYTQRELEESWRWDGSAEAVLCSGRLIEEKKPLLLLEAFRDALPDLPPSARLCFVGDGPMRPALEARARQLGLAGRVAVLGSQFDPTTIGRLHAEALVTVAPGTVGLSIVQSLGFGVPLIFPAGERHGPEIVHAGPGNSMVFPAGDRSALARLLADTFADRARWLGQRAAIRKAASHLTIERMAEGFLDVVACLASRRGPGTGQARD